MTDSYKIRPAARIMRTIGHDLIKDVHAAIVELVKNSYDADSPDSEISFSYSQDLEQLEVCISDSGHGMSFDTVVNKWLVPATEDKLKRKESPKGRILQGRKGIGRFAAAILGDHIKLVTTDESGVTTTLDLDMSIFDEAGTFLHDIEIPVSSEKTDIRSGTKITVTSKNIAEKDIKNAWNPKRIDKLLLELRKLLSPAELSKVAKRLGYSTKEDTFYIRVEFNDFPIEKFANNTFKIEPFPVIDLFDYRIYGFVDNKGIATLTYENQNTSIKPLKIKTKISLLNSDRELYPGKVYIDLRVYDRDPDSIDNMIARGLNDPITNKPVGKREARKILDDFYGVGIYRGKFKIRPYGDADYDWLDLDKLRVQNPSLKVGHNQVIGFINIQIEDESHLVEKSARDGLVENSYYYGLISLVSNTLRQLEVKRFEFREKTLRGGRAGKSADEMIKGIFEFDKIKNSISREIKKAGLTKNEENTISSIVEKSIDKESQKKTKELDDLREKIAIYEGQVTLGKITHVLLHEGRKHIKYILETTPRITRWLEDIIENYKKDLHGKITDRSNEVVSSAKSLSYLFKKVEPLAIARRPAKKYHPLKKVFFDAATFFDVDMSENGISFENKIPTELLVEASEFDLSTALFNLFENSIYWLSASKVKNKKVTVDAFIDQNNLFVHYSDNGPGFQGANLELIFEPGYSMKPKGTGLGLSLAGEAMSRIGGNISALQSDKGAMFELNFNTFKEVK